MMPALALVYLKLHHGVRVLHHRVRRRPHPWRTQHRRRVKAQQPALLSRGPTVHQPPQMHVRRTPILRQRVQLSQPPLRLLADPLALLASTLWARVRVRARVQRRVRVLIQCGGTVRWSACVPGFRSCRSVSCVHQCNLRHRPLAFSCRLVERRILRGCASTRRRQHGKPKGRAHRQFTGGAEAA
jgi:hypothetical protein